MFTITCERCGYENSINDTKCRRCATVLGTAPGEAEPQFQSHYQPSDSRSFVNPSSINKPFVVGLIGSAILFLGVFTPIFSMPFLGNLNYFQNGSGDGVIVLALSLVSIVLILAERYRGLIVTGALSLGMLIFTFASFQYRMSQIRSSLQNDLGGGLFGGLGEALVGSVQLQWGWAVLIIGSVVVISAGLMKPEVPAGHAQGVRGVISNFLGDARVLAGAIAIIVVFALGIVALNLASSSKTIQKATNTVKDTVFPDSSVAAMQDALKVEFVGKKFEKANYERGTFMDSITVEFKFINTGTKDITGFKGDAVFKDMFDEKIKSVDLSYDKQTIKAGQTKTWTGSLDYNQFMGEDQKLRDVPPEKLKFSFNPISIHFSDGTKLEKSKK